MDTQERQFGFERLVVWQLSLEFFGRADEVAARLGRPYGEIADQLRRASLSVICNLAEGVGKDGADQRRFFRIARGSACECAALVEAAARIGLLAGPDRAALRTQLLRIVGALTALARQTA